MSWPLPSDLRAALKNPRVAFRDPRLQACGIETTAGGEPRARSGSSAVVYKAISPDGAPLALRTFNTELFERRERYDEIAKYLQGHKPSCLVGFRYHDDGIYWPRNDAWYPLLVMDWAEGRDPLPVRSRAVPGR